MGGATGPDLRAGRRGVAAQLNQRSTEAAIGSVLNAQKIVLSFVHGWIWGRGGGGMEEILGKREGLAEI